VTRLHADDLNLTPEQRRRLGIPRSREQRFKREDLRREAIGVLAQIRHLTSDQRRRVLEHALKVNEV
jgi:hypothetical protein